MCLYVECTKTQRKKIYLVKFEEDLNYGRNDFERTDLLYYIIYILGNVLKSVVLIIGPCNRINQLFKLQKLINFFHKKIIKH